MRFKIDENLPVDLANLLRGAGHEASTVGEQNMIGEPDERLAIACRDENITLDLDFADIRRYPPERHAGIVVLRVSRQDGPSVVEAFKRIISVFSQESPTGKLWIVEDDRLRIRSGTEKENSG